VSASCHSQWETRGPRDARNCFSANMAHTRQSRPNSGLGLTRVDVHGRKIGFCGFRVECSAIGGGSKWYFSVALICITRRRIPASARILLWKGNHKSRTCSRDTFPESYIAKYASIRRIQSPIPHGTVSPHEGHSPVQHNRSNLTIVTPTRTR